MGTDRISDDTFHISPFVYVVTNHQAIRNDTPKPQCSVSRHSKKVTEIFAGVVRENAVLLISDTMNRRAFDFKLEKC